MLGFFVGTLCLFALIATLRRRHFHRFGFSHGRSHPGHGWGRFGGSDPEYIFHGHHSHHGHRAHSRHSGFMRQLFEQLDTTPGQEKAIAQALAALIQRVDDARGQVRSARTTLAAAIGGDTVNGPALDQALSQQKELLQRFGQDVTQALLSVHEALDGEQRKHLAELIANGPFPGFRGFGRL